MRKLLGSVAFLLLFTSVVAKADLIQNGQFTGSPNTTGPYAGYSDPAYTGDFYEPTNIAGWTFSAASGILKYPGFGQGFFPATIPNGTSQFAFIQNVPGGNAISQTVTDTFAKLYTLSFSATGNINATIPIVLSIDGLPVQTFAATYGWNTYSYVFAGTGSDVISFSSNGGVDFNGFSGAAGLTNVSAISATPEPSSMMLLGTGLLGVAAGGRRKFLKA